MASLLDFIRYTFPPGPRARGEELFTRGKVYGLRGDAHKVTARVMGGMVYDVQVTRSGQVLSVSCDCPAFMDAGPCKHVWAVLRNAAQSGYLMGDDKSAPVEVVDGLLESAASQLSMFDMQAEAAASGFREGAPPPAKTGWRDVVRHAELGQGAAGEGEDVPWPTGRELYFVVNVTLTFAGSGLAVELLHRDPRQSGELGRPKAAMLPRAAIEQMPDAALRSIVLGLAGAPADPADSRVRCVYRLAGARQVEHYLKAMCDTGRCYLRQATESTFDQWMPLVWDDGPAWRFGMSVVPAPMPAFWQLEGRLTRDGETIPLREPQLLIESGFVFLRGTVARLEFARAFGWLGALRRERGNILIPENEAADFAAQVMLSGSAPPPVDWPQELSYEVRSGKPDVRLKIEPMHTYSGDKLMASLQFLYGDYVLSAGSKLPAIANSKNRIVYQRDKEAEREAEMRFNEAGLPVTFFLSAGARTEVPVRRLPSVVRHFSAMGWQVEVEGKAIHRASGVEAELTSGIDWFDLNVTVDFGAGGVVKLPQLLKAMAEGTTLVTLPDGSFGMIPEDFREQYGLLLGLGKLEGDTTRFRRNQAGLLDVLLADRPEINVDAVFARARTALRNFGGVKEAAQPPGFTGELRGYQREGLAWLRFLDTFGFGGCLADDMGVGKTPQVLALMEERRAAGAGPSLIVVPRSLVYNWQQEAARFTPQLKILDHTGAARQRDTSGFSGYNIVLSTYGTLRKDAAEFRGFEFDYVILDEAQAIKNSGSESAKAARLLRGRRRLAMSGTPVENNLGELWSLFEFLNPGMLGSAKVFQGGGASLRNPDNDTRQLLARALRPFILRRTKQQVAAELPPKLEQTLYCELDKKQRKLYNELRDFYRAKLMGKVSEKGLAKSKMHVLEALLRLRQAACHPALIDDKHEGETSAKLEVLLPQLQEVIAEGHKALVFSQFTSFLDILRPSLEREGIRYEYLDGKTTDRRARVERFQQSPEIPLFLISLKAGGVGLNLTAADYVFLLDPWWNPAVEAQAIDRTHRIGQTRHVFAYRLIARDTVEEKVLALQATKRNLAEAIISADNSLIRDLTSQDLELLLS